MSRDWAAALDVATRAAIAAGALLRAEAHRAGGPRHSDPHHAGVDDEMEALIRARLLDAFPTWSYVGEETGSVVGEPAEPTWFVDPHDGTAAFLEGWRGSSASIGLVHDGVPVLGVVFAPLAPDDAGDLVTWAEGQPLRRNGAPLERPRLREALARSDIVFVSQHADLNPAANTAACAPARFRHLASIAYRLALVACGEGEAAVSTASPTRWDLAAGHALVRAVGGEVYSATLQGVVRYEQADLGAHVFGGHLAVCDQLARRDWRAVRERPPPSVLAARYPSRSRRDAAKCPDAGVLARAQGCLLGQLAGDALGQLVEFRTAEAIRATYPDGVRDLHDGGTYDTIAGQPTDDSEMALLLARTLVHHRGFAVDRVRAAYVDWMASQPFDIGHTTASGLGGRPVADSLANGSLMRIAPLAIHGHAWEAPALSRAAVEDSQITHPHPVCCDAVQAYCRAIAHAIRTHASPRDTVECAARWAREPAVRAAIEAARHEPPRDYHHSMGFVLIALQNAFYQLLHAPSAEAGIHRYRGPRWRHRHQCRHRRSPARRGARAQRCPAAVATRHLVLPSARHAPRTPSLLLAGGCAGAGRRSGHDGALIYDLGIGARRAQIPRGRSGAEDAAPPIRRRGRGRPRVAADAGRRSLLSALGSIDAGRAPPMMRGWSQAGSSPST